MTRLARLGQESFDVLLLDLSLPDSSGPETFRRALQAAPHLPIVVLTGANDESRGAGRGPGRRSGLPG